MPIIAVHVMAFICAGMVFTLLAGEIPIMDGMPCYDNFLALADVKPEGWEAPLTRPIPPPPVCIRVALE
jgi:hypothetical protein